MTEAELFRRALIEGAIGGAMVSLIAFLLSKFWKEIAGRTLLATFLFAAAGAYLGFAFAIEGTMLRGWVLVELLQCVAFGTLGLYGWRGNPKWPHSDMRCIRSGISRCTILDQDGTLRRGLTRFFVSVLIGSWLRTFLFTIAQPTSKSRVLNDYCL